MKRIILAIFLILLCTVFVNAQTKIPSYGGICETDEGLLLSDAANNGIWLIKDGEENLICGGTKGYKDGKALECCFFEPQDIEKYLKGYAIADKKNGAVRYFADGELKTLVSGLKAPRGLATDGKNLYISDTDAGIIYQMDETGKLKSLISNLCEPCGICFKNNKLYIAETGKNLILCFENGTLSVLCGIADEVETGIYIGGFSNGKIGSAQFDNPLDVYCSNDGIVYIADAGNHAIRYIENGYVYTLAENKNYTSGLVKPSGICLKGNTLYAADMLTGQLLSFDIKTENFSDVKSSDWFYSTVMEAVKRGLAEGMGNGSFAPKKNITRAQFITLLSRLQLSMDGSTVINGEKGFDDAAGSWFEKEAAWAASNGISEGSGGLFNGNQLLSRQQLVTMLWRFAGSPKGTALPERFSDKDQIASYAKEAFEWAVAKGLIDGISENSLAPNNTATRAQAVSILVRYGN